MCNVKMWNSFIEEHFSKYIQCECYMRHPIYRQKKIGCRTVAMTSFRFQLKWIERILVEYWIWNVCHLIKMKIQQFFSSIVTELIKEFPDNPEIRQDVNQFNGKCIPMDSENQLLYYFIFLVELSAFRT